MLLLGVSDHVVGKNIVEDNDYVGIAVLGWCTSLFGTPRQCTPGNLGNLRGPPESNNNLIYQNQLSGNGHGGGPIPFLAVDAAYFHIADQVPEFGFFEPPGTGNCFKKNKPKNGFTFFSSQPDGQLPTDGC